jgi:glycosyltransferase involved in cell wall biosynthesis
MKVTVVMEAALESGRGPLFRRLGSLPELARRCRLSAVCLAEPDPDVGACLQASQVPYSVHPVRLDGWRITNLDTLVPRIVADVAVWGSDLVVLDWELWDLMRELSAALPRIGARFATVVHAVPFLNTPVHPSSDFMSDVARRLRHESDPAVSAYIRAHAAETLAVLRRLDVLVPNRCVADYLDCYFPGLPVHLMEPSYALDLATIYTVAADGPPLDFAFMARLVPEKGTNELLEVFAKISAQEGFEDARLLVLGSFENETERHRFATSAAALGVLERLELAGWRLGADKYGSLKRAAVFLYPAPASDTFSICMLEALACGLPVVCWDVPFSRAIYATDAVVRCKPGAADAFARAAVQLAAAAGDGDVRAAARDFAGRYGSWAAVARAEAEVYQELLRT